MDRKCDNLSDSHKIAILVLYYFDTVLHGILVIGWSSIRQMLENEGFFLSCDENDTDCQTGIADQRGELSQVFQLTMMLFGPILFAFSIVRVNQSIKNEQESSRSFRNKAFIIKVLWKLENQHDLGSFGVKL